MKNKCNIWCAPLIIYLILSVVIIITTFYREDYMIFSNQPYTITNRLTLMLSQVITVLIWSILMGWLCKTCNEGWAWFVLLLPIILGVLLMILLTLFVDNLNINLNVFNVDTNRKFMNEDIVLNI